MYFFFFNDTATTEIYTLSLHDALPISKAPPKLVWRERTGPAWSSMIVVGGRVFTQEQRAQAEAVVARDAARDRKSTRLNSSHANISYAVFCLKKKKITDKYTRRNHIDT